MNNSPILLDDDDEPVVLSADDIDDELAFDKPVPTTIKLINASTVRRLIQNYTPNVVTLSI